MAVKMRLARAGTKKRPYYHIVIADAAAPRDGKFIDVVGAFNPMLKKDDANRVKLDTEKAAAWLKKGAQATDRVLRFLDKAGLAKREARNNPQKALPGKKRLEREKAAAAPLPPAEAPSFPSPPGERREGAAKARSTWRLTPSPALPMRGRDAEGHGSRRRHHRCAWHPGRGEAQELHRRSCRHRRLFAARNGEGCEDRDRQAPRPRRMASSPS